jgi:hypothetical protein
MRVPANRSSWTMCNLGLARPPWQATGLGKARVSRALCAIQTAREPLASRSSLSRAVYEIVYMRHVLHVRIVRGSTCARGEEMKKIHSRRVFSHVTP